MLLRTWRPFGEDITLATIVHIRSVHQRMRGGSQAFLVEGSDGNCYVAKFSGNPQGTRTLINEWVCYRILQRLEVYTPKLQLLALAEPRPELHFTFGKKSVPVRPGVHLGSQFPVNREKTAIFDFLPRKLLSQVVNRNDFLKILVMDLFSGHADSRQAVFFRVPQGQKLAFRAAQIDHGQAFGGSEWQVSNHRSAFYFDRTVYSGNLDGLNTVIQSLEQLTKQEFDQILAETPKEWWSEQETSSIADLWNQLQRQQRNLRRLVNAAFSELSFKALPQEVAVNTGASAFVSSLCPATIADLPNS